MLSTIKNVPAFTQTDTCKYIWIHIYIYICTCTYTHKEKTQNDICLNVIVMSFKFMSNFSKFMQLQKRVNEMEMYLKM